jgi:hypothetical protein
MAATPESKVKKRVTEVLKQYGVYFFYPVTGGYGRSGVPDIVACWQGRFIGIECKAKGGTVTGLQMKNLNEITSNDGISLLIDETGIGMFALLMDTWQKGRMPPKGYIAELMDTRIRVPKDNGTQSSK